MFVAPKSVASSTMNAVRERIVVGRRKVCMMWFSRSMFSHQWGVTKISLPCGFAISCMADIGRRFVNRTKTQLHEENQRFNFCHSCDCMKRTCDSISVIDRRGTTKPGPRNRDLVSRRMFFGLVATRVLVALSAEEQRLELNQFRSRVLKIKFTGDVIGAPAIHPH